MGVLPGARRASGSNDVKGRETGPVVKEGPDSSVGEAYYRRTTPVEVCLEGGACTRRHARIRRCSFTPAQPRARAHTVYLPWTVPCKPFSPDERRDPRGGPVAWGWGNCYGGKTRGGGRPPAPSNSVLTWKGGEASEG